MKKIAGGVAALALLLAGCSSAPSESPAAVPQSSAAQPSTFTMVGTVTVASATWSHGEPDDCYGKGGYSDLKNGTQVTVYDAAGKAVALGAVTETKWVDPKSCALTWTAADVPGGQGIYQYEVSHRGKLMIKEQDARNGRAVASIGN